MASAQQSAIIEVSYSATQPSTRTGKVERTNQFILLADAARSKFYSPATEYIDSLKSTPEGNAKYKEMARNAYFSDKLDQMPKREGSYYVLKSEADRSITTYDVNGLEYFYTAEEMPAWDWEIADSTKTVLGYECQKASTDFHGRRWTAWFAPEIPVMNGPWKLGGLPGLILEAVDDSGLYRFDATGVQQSAREIGPVYSADNYEKIDRKDFLRAKRKFVDNTLSQINAQLSGTGISIGNV